MVDRGWHEGVGGGSARWVLVASGDVDTRTRNALLRGLRCLGERGFAVLTGRWRARHHFTTSPCKIGTIVKAALVLTQFEQGRLN